MPTPTPISEGQAQDKLLEESQPLLEGMSRRELVDLAQRCGVFHLPRATARDIRCAMQNAYTHIVIARLASQAGQERRN
jgi:hypothetical protein